MNKNEHINLQTIIRHLTSKQCHTTLQDLGVVIAIIVYRTCECITYVTIIIINLLLKVIRLLQLASLPIYNPLFGFVSTMNDKYLILNILIKSTFCPTKPKVLAMAISPLVSSMFKKYRTFQKLRKERW